MSRERPRFGLINDDKREEYVLDCKWRMAWRCNGNHWTSAKWRKQGKRAAGMKAKREKVESETISSNPHNNTPRATLSNRPISWGSEMVLVDDEGVLLVESVTLNHF